jgi:hypothetical protein
VGSITKQDNTLFRAMMRNEGLQHQFLTILGNMMAGPWSTEVIQAKVDERYEAIRNDAVQTFVYFGEGGEGTWNKAVKRFYNYAAVRPAKYLAYIQETLGFTEDEMRVYFGKIMDKIAGVETEAEDVFESEDALTDAVYSLFVRDTLPLIKDGLCATVYTQLSDVEDEINGLITYDRKKIKVDALKIKEANELLKRELTRVCTEQDK